MRDVTPQRDVKQPLRVQGPREDPPLQGASLTFKSIAALILGNRFNAGAASPVSSAGLGTWSLWLKDQLTRFQVSQHPWDIHRHEHTITNCSLLLIEGTDPRSAFAGQRSTALPA